MKKTSILVSAALIFLAGACKKKEQANKDFAPAETKSVSKNGILTFDSHAEFYKTNDQLWKLKPIEAENWGKEKGFTSQRTIFDKVILEENAYDSSLYLADPLQVKNAPHHSPFYYATLKKGIITETEKGTENETYNYSVYNPSLAPVINEKGLVVINDTIYQLAADCRKMIVDGDYSKIDKLLNAKETDLHNGIVVEKVNVQHNQSSNRLEGTNDFSRTPDWITSGKQRIKLSVNFTSNLGSSGMQMNVTHWAQVQSQDKNFWGTWKYTNGVDITLQGSWTSTYRVGSYPTNYFYPSYYSAVNGNNYIPSIHPETGAGAATGTSWLYTAQPYGQTFWPGGMSITSGSWYATRSGGCCGVHTSMSW